LSYRLHVARSADSYQQRLPIAVQQRIATKLAAIAADPFDSRTSKPLTSAGQQRAARVGGFRIIFTVDREQQLINVDEIGPRGQIYRRL